MPINALKPLLAKPNPIPMARWLTIGALDAEEWTTDRRRPLAAAGRRASWSRAWAAGFGGRSLCLSKAARAARCPSKPAVTVKLEDESGAAGLVFHADGKDKHYGFYPSDGGAAVRPLRGTRCLLLARPQGTAQRCSTIPASGTHSRCALRRTSILLSCNGKLVLRVGRQGSDGRQGRPGQLPRHQGRVQEFPGRRPREDRAAVPDGPGRNAWPSW